MKIYLVGPDGQDIPILRDKVGFYNFLFSYVELKSILKNFNYEKKTFRSGVMNLIVENAKTKKLSLFLDSGAHSAYYSGVIIKSEELCSFALRFRRLFDIICSLDVVFDPVASMENYKDMVRSGIDDCLPVFHVGEPWEYLEKYCEISDFIGIGGLVRLSAKPEVRRWAIDKSIRMIENHDRKIKIHLFGMTDSRLIGIFGKRVYSIDSSSWRNGGIYAEGLTSQILSPQRFLYQYGKSNSVSGRRLNYINAFRLKELENTINSSSDVDELN